MDSSAIVRAVSCQLCPRCFTLFLAPKNEEHLKKEAEEEVRRLIKQLAPDFIYSAFADDTTCPCCFNGFVGTSLEDLCAAICADLDVRGVGQRSIFLRILIPPMLDTARITVRTIATRTNEKIIPFPTMAELTLRLLTHELVKARQLNIVSDVTVAEIQVNVTAVILNQTEFCQALYSDYQHKKKKKKFGETASVEPFEVTRADADSVLVSYKSFKQEDFNHIQSSLINYMTSGVSKKGLNWQVEVAPSPIYLLGRYRKYARDVPQAPWTLDDERKGRNSVEEIVTESVMRTLKGSSCKMHPCGREDIDVRCLGNGRPFILEMSGSFISASEVRMQEIIEYVSSRHADSLNREGDVELLMLKKSHRSVWENMQTVAEEKRKAYRCVCWTALPIDAAILKMLESSSNSPDSVDEEGRPCLKLVQKTPLRVLHRRSLLDRVRYVYNIQTAPLGEHFFVMDITTSAGTYVKEFVHGDLGRTVPSVCSLLGCQADILQLDVVWLFDDFDGGGEPPIDGASYQNSRFSAIMNSAISNADNREQKHDDSVAVVKNPDNYVESYSWNALKNMKIIKQKRLLSVECV